MSEDEDLTRIDLHGRRPGELREFLARIDVELNELHTGPGGELRELDADEADRFDRLGRVRDAIEARLRAHEYAEQVYRRNPNAVRTAYGNLSRGDPVTRDAAEVLGMGGDELRSSALRLLEARGGDLPAAAQDRIAESVTARLGPHNPNLDGSYVARRLLITESDAYRSAFLHMMTEDHPLLTEAEIRAVRAFRENEARAMGEVTGSAGGMGVPTLIDPSILLQSGAEAAPLLSAARVLPVTTNHWKGVSSAPPTFTFVTEAGASADASPTLAQPEIYVHMARSWIPYSFEVESDYPSFAAEMGALLQQGWTDSVATKTITGTGSGEPFGILTKLDATTTSEVRVTTAGTFDAAQIFRVWNALPERFRSRARWIMSVSVESAIRAFGATPSPSAYFTCDLTADGITRLNGRPNLVTDYMPTLVSGTSTGNYLVVGDLAAAYTVCMRQGLTVERVPFVFQQTTAGTGIGNPTAQRGFLAWGRWGADAIVPGAARLLNQT